MTGVFTLSVFVLCLTILPWVTANTHERYVEFFSKTVPNNPQLLELWKRHVDSHNARVKRAKPHRYTVPTFDCHTKYPGSGMAATSVHKLHPSDISIVAAMGDSLTAGNAIDSRYIWEALIEYRGLSWSIGGDSSLDKGVLTLPNILKKYNSKLHGYSLGRGDVDSANAHLNVAHPGDTSYHMPGQAKLLIKKLKAEADYKDGWKLITLLIGGNDLCESCLDYDLASAENYVKNIKNALDQFHAEVPKVFFNLVLMSDIEPIANVGSDQFFCTLAHDYVCPCAKNASSLEALAKLTAGYQKGLVDLVGSGRYDTRDDFTVVLQPFFKNTLPPKQENNPNEVDLTYFGADCFHFSGKGQGAAAISLWNNMCERVGTKKEIWYRNQPFHCPGSLKTGDPIYFPTAKN